MDSKQHSIHDQFMEIRAVLGEYAARLRDEGPSDRAKPILTNLEEQLEAAQDGWKAAAGLSADLSSFGRALEEIAEFIEGRHKEGDTDYQAALIARRVLNGDSFPAKEPS